MAIPASWSDAVALQVDGLSCWPTYDNGDIIIVRGEQRLTESEFLNRMCVVRRPKGWAWSNAFGAAARRACPPGKHTFPPIEDVSLSSARPVRMHLSD